jgi:MYXO-CTERM domain-containing protein
MSRFNRFLIAAFAGSLSASAFGLTNLEDFSTNSDGRWEALNNLTGNANPNDASDGQHYAWSNTNNVTGGAPGELGGVILRDADPPNFYAFNVGSLNPVSENFSASGLMKVTVPDGGSGFYLGFFKKNAGSPADVPNGFYGAGGDPHGFMGVGFGDMHHAQAFLFSQSGGRDRSGVDPSTGIGVTIPWSIDWTVGTGLTVTINGVPQGPVTPGDGAASLGIMDHFGIFATSADGADGEVFFDNISFTSDNPLPEPASLSLLAVGGLAVVRRRRM